MTILEEMKVRRLFCDGGMGSLLQAQGLKPGELPETWNLTRLGCAYIHTPVRIWRPAQTS